MAHHKDAIKRIRTNEQARQRNRADRSRMRSKLKELRGLLADGDLAAAKAVLPEAQSLLHRLARKGVIHRNKAARHISRLALQINGGAES